MDLTNVSAAKLSVLRAVNVIEKTTKIIILLFLYFFTMAIIFLKKSALKKCNQHYRLCLFDFFEAKAP